MHRAGIPSRVCVSRPYGNFLADGESDGYADTSRGIAEEGNIRIRCRKTRFRSREKRFRCRKKYFRGHKKRKPLRDAQSGTEKRKARTESQKEKEREDRSKSKNKKEKDKHPEASAARV